jgi:hypothetical protein
MEMMAVKLCRKSLILMSSVPLVLPNAKLISRSQLNKQGKWSGSSDVSGYLPSASGAALTHEPSPASSFFLLLILNPSPSPPLPPPSLCVCYIGMCIWSQVPGEASIVSRTPWSWSYRQLLVSWFECWKPNWSPLPKQYILLTVELSLFLLL